MTSTESQQLLEKKQWKKHRTGEIINIADMVDEYLQFTIAMLKRGYDVAGRKVSDDRDIFIPMLEQEALKRGLEPAEDGWDE